MSYYRLIVLMNLTPFCTSTAPEICIYVYNIYIYTYYALVEYVKKDSRIHTPVLYLLKKKNVQLISQGQWLKFDRLG